jgi:hypothetical protein
VFRPKHLKALSYDSGWAQQAGDHAFAPRTLVQETFRTETFPARINLWERKAVTIAGGG